MTDEPFSATSAIARAFEETKRHFASTLLPMAALTLVLGALEGSAQRADQGLLHLALQVLSMLVTMGWWRIALRIHERRPVSLGLLTDVTVIGFVRYLLTMMFFWIAVGIGLALLVVPGLYVGARLSMAPALAIDEDLEPVAALRRSWELTEGATADLWVLGLLLAGLNLLGALLLGLGLLVTIPVTFLAAVHALRWLEAQAPRAARADGTPAAI